MKYFELDCLLFFFWNDIWTFGRIFEYEKEYETYDKIKNEKRRGKKEHK